MSERKSPSIEDLTAAVSDRARSVFQVLRSQSLSEPGVTERVVFDGLAKEWTPAFYYKGKQLFHVHLYEDGVNVTFPVSAKVVRPLILQSPDVPERFKAAVKAPRPRSDALWLAFPLMSEEDVKGFMTMARVKLRAFRSSEQTTTFDRF